MKENKYCVYKKLEYISSKYKKSGFYYKKKITEVKINNIRVKRIIFLFSKNSNSEKD